MAEHTRSVELDLSDTLSTGDRSILAKLSRNEAVAALCERWIARHPKLLIRAKTHDLAPIVAQYMALQRRIEEQYAILHGRTLRRLPKPLPPIEDRIREALARPDDSAPAPAGDIASQGNVERPA